MATNPAPRRQPSIGSMIVWVLFCFVMWAWAIMGPLILMAWGLSFFVDVVDLGANPNETVRMAAGFGTLGIAFVWLRCRGYLKFGERD
jgi:hypothetical protein